MNAPLQPTAAVPDPGAATPVVHLVGAGLGDVGSLTRRAARLLREADVVVVDRPSLDPVVALAPGEAEVVHVGRLPGRRAWATDAVVALLVDRAGAGQRVVRLKGGDPFLCSRGGEEALALVERGVRVEVTPGVTAASAAGGAAGLERGDSITVASGNHDPAGPEVAWAGLGREAGALVVLTGRAHHGAIVDGLAAGGRSPRDRAAVVHGAGRVDVEVVPTSLADLAQVRLAPPAAMVVAPRAPGGDRAHP